MSGTLIIQPASADMSGNPSQIILPGTLASGLIGHFYLNQSLANAIKNLAPGAVQAGVVNGNPTIGAGFLNLQSGVNTITSGVIETAAMTVMWTGRSDDPLTANDVYWAGNAAVDAGQGSGLVGTSLYSFHGVSPTSGNLSMQTYFGATYATKAAATINLASQNVTTWAVWAMSVQGVSPWTMKSRNLTTGASFTGAGANPRQINTTQPFLIGGRPAAGGNGISQMASFSVWNRDLSDTECANMRSLVIAPYMSGKWGITV
jgi:hypothetical protein